MANATATPLRPVAQEICLIVAMTGALFASLIAIDLLFDLKLARAFAAPLLLVVVPLIGFSLLERILPPAGPRKSLRHWLLHLRINIFINYASTLVVPSLLAVATAAISRHFELGLIDLRFASGHGLLALIGAVVVSMVVGDFFFYWYHRLQHRSAVFWQIHKVHHMDPALDALADGRHSWVDQFPRVLFIFIPLTVLFKLDDVDPLQAGLTSGIVIGAIQTIHRCLEHCNVKWHFGWLTPIVCGPQVHRIHHSRLEQHRDRNFAGVTPLWDILFGTYYGPARHEFPATGVDDEKEFETFLEAQTLTLREWRRMFCAWRRRRSTEAAALDHTRGS